jgi:hypothetical protein
MSETNFSLPIPPTEESLQLLLRARLMLSHAMEHASQKTEFDNMIAILGLDNTIESILRCIATHLDLETRSGKTFDIIDLASLAAEINKSLVDLTGTRLSYVGDIKLLRQTRNLVQHGAVAPNADLDRFATITQRFFDKVLQSIFGLELNALRISAVIKENLIREFLQRAESFIDEKNWLLSVVASRDAFENEYFRRIKSLNTSISLYPSIVFGKEEFGYLGSGFDAVRQELELSYLGINDSDYRRFKEYINHIPHEYCPEDSWGQTVMQRPWNRDDANFCYTFSANTILRWQAREKERLYVPKLDKRYDFVQTINDINLTQDGEIGCVYSYGDGHEFILCYVPKETMKAVTTLQKGENYLHKVERFVDDVKDHSHEEEVQILGKRKFLATNSPERWAIVLWFRRTQGSFGEYGFLEETAS